VSTWSHTRGGLRLGYHLHPRDRYAWCGERTELTVVVASTHALGARCADVVACARRARARREAS
jgi:hypothetical protein